MAENDQTQEKTQEPRSGDWKRPEKMEIFYLLKKCLYLQLAPWDF